MDLGAPAAFAMDLAAHARFQCLRMDQRRVCYDLTADPERCQSWRQWLHDQYPELAREVSELERRRRDGEPEEPEKPKLTIVNLISDDEIHIEDGTLTDTADTEEDPDTVRAPPEPPTTVPHRVKLISDNTGTVPPDRLGICKSLETSMQNHFSNICHKMSLLYQY